MGNTEQRALRIRFTDVDTAYEQFHVFAPLDLLDGYSRKRDGASHVMLFENLPTTQFAEFIAACVGHPAVVSFKEISVGEFWTAPSNAI